jgi:hypothetical protein
MPTKAHTLQHNEYQLQRLTGLRASAEQKKQGTVQRLQAAIATLLSQGQPITLAGVVREGGPAWSTIKRNEEALAVWKKHKPERATTARTRDPVLSYSRAELIARLRQERDRRADLEGQLEREARAHALTKTHYERALTEHLMKDERIAQLEAKLARYDQHLSGLRDSLNHAEHR